MLLTLSATTTSNCSIAQWCLVVFNAFAKDAFAPPWAFCKLISGFYDEVCKLSHFWILKWLPLSSPRSTAKSIPRYLREKEWGRTVQIWSYLSLCDTSTNSCFEYWDTATLKFICSTFTGCRCTFLSNYEISVLLFVYSFFTLLIVVTFRFRILKIFARLHKIYLKWIGHSLKSPVHVGPHHSKEFLPNYL